METELGDLMAEGMRDQLGVELALIGSGSIRKEKLGQFSKGFFCEFDRKNHSIISLNMNGNEVGDDDVFTVAMQNHFYQSMKDNFDITTEEIENNGKKIEAASSAPNVMEEYFRSHESLKLDGEQRLIIR